LAKIDFVKQFNFGDVKHKDTVKHVFEIKNVSDIPLTITKIGTSCGCTAAVLTDSTANKNEVAKIEVSYTPKKDTEGKIQNSIVIEANTNPAYTVLYLEGIVKD
jgi:hypothetical protein